MAVLEKIRVKLGIFITVVIALALLSFIVDPTTLETTLNTFSSKYDVGEIDGESISIQEYQEKVDYFSQLYSLTTGNQSIPEEALNAVYESAWQELKNERFVLPSIKNAGIMVGEDELFDLSQGKEISPIIMQESMFKDETGNFSRTQFADFIRAIPSDPSGNLGRYWSFIEKNMYNQQYFIKYNSLLSQSNILNPIELIRNIDDNNIISSVDFIIAPYGFERDSSIVVTDAEVKEYYNKHKENYKQDASRDVEFVAFEVVPSERDIEAAQNSINEIYEDFAQSDNLRSYLAANSDVPFDTYYYEKGELESEYPELDEFAFSANPSVLPVFQHENSFIAARVSDVKTMSDSAFVQHILVLDTQRETADSLLGVINRGGNFSELASQYSLDQNPNVANPGDIGWLTQTSMLPGFESVLYSSVDKPFILESDYGIHIVNITDRTANKKKVQLALLVRDATASKETYQTYYSQANDLASKSEGKIENFNKVVEENNLPVIPVNYLAQGARNLSMYEGTREITRWVYDADKGDVSPIITVDNDIFFVVAVTEVREEGYMPIADVSFNIKGTLEQEKKGEKMALEVGEKIKGMTSMDEMATALNTTVSSRDDIAFGSITSQSLDPILIGAIAGAPIGELKGPIAGSIGVYLFKVNSRETGSFYTEDDAKLRALQMQSFQTNMLPLIFDEMGEIKDNRVKFY